MESNATLQDVTVPEGDDAIVLALAGGKSQTAAAELASVCRDTVQRRLRDPEFRAKVERVRGEMIERATGLMAEGAVSAVLALRKIVENENSPSVQVSAAGKLLQNLNLNLPWQVTDTGLRELAGLKSLQSLDLPRQVTDAGLKELAGLKSLQSLNLGNTQVTDAGLKELTGLTSLQSLNLLGTLVTPEGFATLQKALPRCGSIAYESPMEAYERSVEDWEANREG